MKKNYNFSCFGDVGCSSGKCTDRVRCSQHRKQGLNGTARFVSMGGAMGALGGDISTMLQTLPV